MRNTFIAELHALAAKDERIFLLTADLGFSVVEKFAEAYPDRFLNVGIAEQNMIGIAAGLALSGYKPWVYSIIPFVTMRCFEQVRVDVAYQQTNVKLVGVGAGLGYGPAGATHHAIEDLALMRALPNLTVVAPGDPHEVRQLTRALAAHQGPAYFRLGKGGEPTLHAAETRVELGHATPVREGADGALFCTSNQLDVAVKLVDGLAAKGHRFSLHSFHTIKPLDLVTVDRAIAAGRPLFTLEEHSTIGGLGSAVSERIAESGRGVVFERFGLPDTYTHEVGSQGHLRKHFGLEPSALEARVLKRISGHTP